LRKQEWVVYAKALFFGPQHVLEYLGRYTHRVAISNRRLLALENGHVSFAWKDYRDSGQDKVMTVTAEEFIRRFLQHALPPGFQRIIPGQLSPSPNGLPARPTALGAAHAASPVPEQSPLKSRPHVAV
jgi:hypothetical protein